MLWTNRVNPYYYRWKLYTVLGQIESTIVRKLSTIGPHDSSSQLTYKKVILLDDNTPPLQLNVVAESLVSASQLVQHRLSLQIWLAQTTSCENYWREASYSDDEFVKINAYLAVLIAPIVLFGNNQLLVAALDEIYKPKRELLQKMITKTFHTTLVLRI